MSSIRSIIQRHWIYNMKHSLFYFRLKQHLKDRYVDVLINNAGGSTQAGFFGLPIDCFEKQLKYFSL